MFAMCCSLLTMCCSYLLYVPCTPYVCIPHVYSSMFYVAHCLQVAHILCVPYSSTYVAHIQYISDEPIVYTGFHAIPALIYMYI